MSNQQIIEDLLTSTDRQGIDDLLQYMWANNFYQAPCSSQYHLAVNGGLAQHSLNVRNTIVKMAEALNYSGDPKSLEIVSLLHDIGKAGYYGKQNYVPNILKGGKQSDSKPFTTNPEIIGLPHEIASFHIVSKFINLTENEVQALIYHNGLYVPSGRDVNGKETELLLLLHFSDLYSCRITEGNPKQFNTLF